MRKVLTLLLFLSLAGSVMASAEPPALETILPADTDLIFVIEDVPASQEKCKNGPWGRLWDDPELKPFTDALRESLDAENWDEQVMEATGLSLTEIFENFTGQAAIVLPDLEALMNEEETGTDAPFAFIAELDDEQLLAALMSKDLEREREKKAEEGQTIREVEDTVHGVTLHVRMLEKDGDESEWQAWALAGGIAVAGEPVSYVRELISGIQGNPPSAPLAGLAEFQRMREQTGKSDAYCYVNLSSFASAMLAEIAVRNEGDEAPANPMGLDEHAVLEALALDVFRGMYVSTVQNEDHTRVDVGLFYNEERGLAKLLAYPPGLLNKPDFIPDDVMGVSIGRFSMEQFWDGLLEILATVNPGLTAMLQGQLDQMSVSLGVSIEKDILRNFGDDVFGTYFPDGDSGELSQVAGVQVRDPERMMAALNALQAMIGQMSETSLFVPREVLGTTVYVMELPEAEGPYKSFSYAVAHGYLLIGMGSNDAMEAMLEAMDKPGKPIWERADVKKHLAGMPADAYMVAYYDLPQLLRMMYESVSTELEKDEYADRDFDLDDALPAIERMGQYFGAIVEFATKTPEGLFGTARVVHAEP